MKNIIKNSLIIILNIIIFYFFINWIVENIDIVKLKTIFSSLSGLTLISIFSINIVVLFFYAIRLSTLLEKSFKISFYLVNLAYGLNTILPFRMGEVTKVVYAKKIFEIPTSQFLVATIGEKTLDILFILFVLATFFLFSMKGYISINIFFLLLFLFVGLISFILLFNKTIPTFLEKLNDSKIKSFLLAIYNYSQGHDIRKLLVQSFFICIVNILAIYITFNLLLDIEFTILHSLAIFIVIIFAIALPATPASLGIFEAAIVSYLVTVLKVESEHALASAIIFHMSIIIPQLLMMLLVFIQWKFISRKSDV